MGHFDLGVGHFELPNNRGEVGHFEPHRIKSIKKNIVIWLAQKL